MDPSPGERPARPMPEPRRDLTGIVLGVATVLILAGASLWTLRAFLGALIWATMVVIATWGLLLRLEARFGGRRWAATLVSCLGTFLLLAIPFTLAVGTIVDNASVVKDWLTKVQTSGLPAAPDRIARIPMVGDRLTAGWSSLAQSGPDGLGPQLEPYARKAFQWVLGVVGNIGSTLVQFVLMIGIAAVLYIYGETAVRGVTAFCTRLAGDRGEKIVALAGVSIRGVALGVVLTAIIQAALCGIALLATGVPHVALLVLLIFMMCVIQAGGTPVMLPAAIYLWIAGSRVAAVILVIAMMVIGGVAGLIRPLLIKRAGADLSLMLIIPGVIGGLISFGLIGIFIGPVVLAVTYSLLESWVQRT